MGAVIHELRLAAKALAKSPGFVLAASSILALGLGLSFYMFGAINAYILRTELLFGVPLSEAWSVRAGFLAEYVKVTTDPNNELTTQTTIGLGYKF